MAVYTRFPRDISTFYNDTYANSTIVTEVPLIDELSEKIANAINVYYTPVLIVLGTLGNITSIIVFFSSKLRTQSTSQYLSALAVSDTIFLLQLVPPWLKAVNASGLFTEKIFCQLFVYLSYVSCNNSSWLVVAFTVERFVAVVHPLRRNAVCTVKRARLIIFILAVFSISLNAPVIIFAISLNNDCNIDFAFMDDAARFNVVDTVLSFSLPLFVITVLNALIMVGVYRLGRTRRHLIKNNSRNSNGAGMTKALTWQKSQQRVTRMLLIVSSVFVLLNLPAYTMRIVAYATKMNETEYSGRWAALQQICLMFFNTNYGINFYLYCMSGQNFRHALCQTFPFLRRRRQPEDPDRLNTSQRPRRPTSMSTSYTEGTNSTTAAVASTNGGTLGEGVCSTCTKGRRRRQRQERFVRRWRFDNSRQQYGGVARVPLDAPAFEMTTRPRQPAPPSNI